MLSNYFKIALRNLVKHKAFSFINIFGLALSMSVCLLIIMLIKDAYSYDRFHPDGDRVYRIVTIPERKDSRTESYATSPFILGKTLQEESPLVEAWSPLIRSFSGSIEINDNAFVFGGMFTDASFFEVFGFELAHGDPSQVFSEPYAIVLSDDLAQAMFGDVNAIGKTVEIPGYASSFKVTGVLKPFEGKTHLEFTALGSLKTQYAEERQSAASMITTTWQDYYRTYNFIKLKDGVDKADIEHTLASLAKTKYAGLELESRDNGYHFSLQALYDITPGGMISNSMGEGMPIFLLYFLGALGLIIILSSCFNYTNLTIARSLVRTKEVGVRKVLGASRRHVFTQILGEAVFTALLSLVMAYVLLKLVKSQFEKLSIAEAFDIAIKEDFSLYGLFLLFTIAIGVIAGILPALTLSKTRPITVLQKLQSIKLMQRLGLRKALLTIQSTVTMVFLMTLTIAWKQADHAIHVNFGFDQPQTLLVETQGVSFDKTALALGNVSGVEKVSGISFAMGTWQDASDDVRIEATAEKFGVREYFIDHNYLGHFGIDLVAGENFPENPAQQKEQFVIVNETFVRNFKLGEPGDAIRKPLYLGDSLQVIIRGVTEDFPFKPATYALEPLMLRYDPEQLNIVNLELSDQNIPATLAALESEWKKLAPDSRFEAVFFDEEVRNNFSDALDLVHVVGFFGILGMVIACMGLLGLCIYTVETKAKEISIRKVMGASVRDIVTYLSKSYLILFVIAVGVSLPLSFLLGTQLLQIFADRISMSALLFLPGILAMFFVTGVTVGSQAFRAAHTNPIEALRSE